MNNQLNKWTDDMNKIEQNIKIAQERLIQAQNNFDAYGVQEYELEIRRLKRLKLQKTRTGL